MKSLEEIDDIVSKTFTKYGDKMKFSQFKDTVQNKQSDVFLQIICFLYQQRPFSSKNIESLEVKFQHSDDKEYEKMVKLYNTKYKKRGSVKIKSPNQLSILSPAPSFFRSKFSLEDVSIGNINSFRNRSENIMVKNDLKNSVINSSQNLNKSDLFLYENNNFNTSENNSISNMSLDGNISLVRLDNDTTLDDIDRLKELGNKENPDKKDIKEVVENSKFRYNSPTKFLKEKDNLSSLTLLNIDFEHNLFPINEENEFQNEIYNNNEVDNNDKDNDKNGEKNICYENSVYKLTESKKLKKFYLSLVNKDIYYYKDASKNNFLGMHNLSGCFIQEESE
jgi:hypothetical protein